MKCLIIEEVHPSLMPLLKELAIEPDYRPQISKEEVLEIIGNYEIIFLRSKIKINSLFCQKAAKLKIIARSGAGIDQIDEQVVAKNKITIISAPEGNRDAVAEHTLGMILCLLNKIHIADCQVRQLQWKREQNRGIELQGKTVAIIGYGNMGQATALRFSGFKCQVIAYDSCKQDYGNAYARAVSLEQVYEKADIVSLHIPLWQQNRYWINDEFIGKFKKNIYLINMARGELICLKTIIKGMESGKILGVCLDVLENEKLHMFTANQRKSFDHLAASQKVLFTPHIGGWTHESYQRLNEVLIDKIKRIIK